MEFAKFCKNTSDGCFWLNQFCVLYLVLGLKNPDGIAYDWITGFLYWTDAQENTVSRLKNKVKEILVHEGLDEPRAIALNPCDSELLVFLFICFSGQTKLVFFSSTTPCPPLLETMRFMKVVLNLL